MGYLTLFKNAWIGNQEDPDLQRDLAQAMVDSGDHDLVCLQRAMRLVGPVDPGLTALARISTDVAVRAAGWFRGTATADEILAAVSSETENDPLTSIAARDDLTDEAARTLVARGDLAAHVHPYSAVADNERVSMTVRRDAALAAHRVSGSSSDTANVVRLLARTDLFEWAMGNPAFGWDLRREVMNVRLREVDVTDLEAGHDTAARFLAAYQEAGLPDLELLFPADDFGATFEMSDELLGQMVSLYEAASERHPDYEDAADEVRKILELRATPSWQLIDRLAAERFRPPCAARQTVEIKLWAWRRLRPEDRTAEAAETLMWPDLVRDSSRKEYYALIDELRDFHPQLARRAAELAPLPGSDNSSIPAWIRADMGSFAYLLRERSPLSVMPSLAELTCEERQVVYRDLLDHADDWANKSASAVLVSAAADGFDLNTVPTSHLCLAAAVGDGKVEVFIRERIRGALSQGVDRQVFVRSLDKLLDTELPFGEALDLAVSLAC